MMNRKERERNKRTLLEMDDELGRRLLCNCPAGCPESKQMTQTPVKS